MRRLFGTDAVKLIFAFGVGGGFRSGEILFGVLLEFVQAFLAAEVVGSTVVFGLEFCGFGVDDHFADRVYYGWHNSLNLL